MGLGFVERLRRWWKILGINFFNSSVDIEIDDQNNGAAQQKILDGAIVKEVLRDALKVAPCLIFQVSGCLYLALPTFDAFKGFLLFLQHYPTEPPRNLIPYLYGPINRCCQPILRPRGSSLAGT